MPGSLQRMRMWATWRHGRSRRGLALGAVRFGWGITSRHSSYRAQKISLSSNRFIYRAFACASASYVSAFSLQSMTTGWLSPSVGRDRSTASRHFAAASAQAPCTFARTAAQVASPPFALFLARRVQIAPGPYRAGTQRTRDARRPRSNARG